MIRWSLLALTLAAGAARLGAQTFPPPANAEAARVTKRAEAVRLDRDAIRLDGRLDDDAWRSARWITDFVQKEPNEGAEPTERTEVAFYYDDAALYVGARMYARDPARIQAPLTRRDVGAQSEHIWISLDTHIAPDATGDSLVVRDANGYRRAVGRPDFNRLSFRSNLVLRWEWRRGSTLFLVWQADRGAADGRGEHVGLGEWWDAFRAPGRNFLAFKVSYWLPVS